MMVNMSEPRIELLAYIAPYESGFTVTVPKFPQIMIQAATAKDALAMAAETVRAALVRLRREGRDFGMEPADTIVLIPEDVAPRHPEIDAAIAEGLEDIRAGRATPAFTTAMEYRAWRRTTAGKRFARP